MKRIHIHLQGIVQGVGFRPFVYNLANNLGLKGWVLNSSEGVHIEIEGNDSNISDFLRLLVEKKPPRAEIKEIRVEELEPINYKSFEIRESQKEENEFVLISPDIATCNECLKELFDPNDRRYRYPFINCTNCGPRFTIIEDIPYDRPKTTMKKFEMCSICKSEYEDPSNRRFHAQPNACHDCGPSLMFLARKEIFEKLKLKGKELNSLEKERLLDFEIKPRNGFMYLTGEKALKAAEVLLKNEMVLALKGLGGFHLSCLAKSYKAVECLRKRKRRPSKAFAVMFKNIEDARQSAMISKEAEELLLSPQAPIVLAPKKKPEFLAENVAPGLADYGIMLPSTPLHHLLLSDVDEPLVMTSGNLSEEPIAKDNEEAIEKLENVADGFLIHNRPIHSRYDDSVISATDSPFLIRRARSYAPYPIDFPYKHMPPIFAAGPELKCTFTLTKDSYAFVSQHLGDLEDEQTYKTYNETFELFKKLFRIDPEIFACDLHPNYLSTRFAEEVSGMKNLYRVQHHFAHIASVIGEHNIEEPSIGFAFDGTGYGTDRTVWGGEVIFVEKSKYSRLASLSLFPLPTGEAAVKKPYRIAAAILAEIDKEAAYAISGDELQIIEKLLRSGMNTFLTSSMGRLFDAVAVILGVGIEATYEGELAMKLEALARGIEPENCLDFGKYEIEIIEKGRDGLIEISWHPIILGILNDIRKKTDKRIISLKFHNTIASAVVKVADILYKQTGANNLLFSGGVFQNSLLNSLIRILFKNSKFKLYFHNNLPPNDGCISFGQAVYVAQSLLI
ncbi:MAG: carbamoyltransferase HypF [Actinobacteria bacterium]|nr:carbamoyltransferase HypF [Actinomycetota bacterium]